MRLPDRNESKRKGERTCANFAHVRRQAIEPPALSVQSIIGAMQNLRSKLFISFSFSFQPRPERHPIRRAPFLPRVYFFYDHTGAIGKAFACIDLLRAHPRIRPDGSAEATSRRSRKAPTFSCERNGIQGRAPHGGLPPSHANRSHFHDAAAAGDNCNERRSRCIDARSRHRYRSQRGGA